MERRRREQRLKIDERQRRSAHVHGHGPPPQFHRGPDHLHDPLSRHRQRSPGGQPHALHQHHGQPGEGLRQQVPRIHEGVEGIPVPAHRQGDGPAAAPLVAPADQIPDGTDQRRQQAQPIEEGPEGHGAGQRTAGPMPDPPRGQQQQPAAQHQRRQEQGQEGSQILPTAEDKRRQQQAERPPRQAQQPRPLSQGGKVPQRSQQGGEGRLPRFHRQPAQGRRQLQQQPVHREVVQ